MQQYKNIFYQFDQDQNWWQLSDSEDLSVATVSVYDADYMRIDEAIDDFINIILPEAKQWQLQHNIQLK